MVCKKCGSENDVTAKFCSRCGCSFEANEFNLYDQNMYYEEERGAYKNWV